MENAVRSTLIGLHCVLRGCPSCSSEVAVLPRVISLLTFHLSAAAFTGQVVRVLDGDTLEGLHNQHPERIRLSGIDCPEKGHFLARIIHDGSSRTR